MDRGNENQRVGWVDGHRREALVGEPHRPKSQSRLRLRTRSHLDHCPLLFAFLAFLACISPAAAQQGSPHIGYVYPAGGRQGATFQVTVGGQFLDGVDQVFVSGAGVEAKVVEYVKPMTQQQFGQLRERLEELQKKEKDAQVRKEIAEIRQKIATFIRRPISPSIVETVTIEVTAAADAEIGPRELRLGTPAGLTDPLAFCLGQLPEFSKKPAKNLPPPRGSEEARNRNEQVATPPEPPINISLPAVVNGQIMPGEFDRYRFVARKGEELVVAVSARELIPYLADAVPGWFQAAVTLYDPAGKELAFADHFRFHPDPVLHYVIAKDGQYMIEIRDSIYRGREDFVYRITLGELPYVTGIFPLGGKAGEQTTLALQGWNLPLTKMPYDARGMKPGIYPFTAGKGERLSNRLPFALDTLPECLAQEPNDSPEKAQRVTLPIIINGRIERPGECDVFSFEGRAGSPIVAEVMARRLDSPLDSVLKLTDAAGKQLAFNDDYEDKGTGLNTHHADSWLTATLPANGTYYVHLSDAQQKGGPEYAYRLRISPPRPDFELRVVPPSVNVRGVASTPLTVYALRKDGFSGEITLSLKDAPAGFALSGGRIPAKEDKARFTLALPSTPLPEAINIAIEGRATIAGQPVVHPAVPAEDMMQAFAYRHLVPAQELKVAAWGRRVPRIAVRLLGATPVKIPAGGTVGVRVALPLVMSSDRVRFELDQPPEGITIKDVTWARDGTEIMLASDAAKVKPGLKGSLIINAFPTGDLPGGKGKGKANRPRPPVGTLPAIAFEVVGR